MDENDDRVDVLETMTDIPLRAPSTIDPIAGADASATTEASETADTLPMKYADEDAKSATKAAAAAEGDDETTAPSEADGPLSDAKMPTTASAKRPVKSVNMPVVTPSGETATMPAETRGSETKEKDEKRTSGGVVDPTAQKKSATPAASTSGAPKSRQREHAKETAAALRDAHDEEGDGDGGEPVDDAAGAAEQEENKIYGVLKDPKGTIYGPRDLKSLSPEGPNYSAEKDPNSLYFRNIDPATRIGIKTYKSNGKGGTPSVGFIDTRTNAKFYVIPPIHVAGTLTNFDVAGDLPQTEEEIERRIKNKTMPKTPQALKQTEHFTLKPYGPNSFVDETNTRVDVDAYAFREWRKDADRQMVRLLVKTNHPQVQSYVNTACTFAKWKPGKLTADQIEDITAAIYNDNLRHGFLRKSEKKAGGDAEGKQAPGGPGTPDGDSMLATHRLFHYLDATGSNKNKRPNKSRSSQFALTPLMRKFQTDAQSGGIPYELDPLPMVDVESNPLVTDEQRALVRKGAVIGSVYSFSLVKPPNDQNSFLRFAAETHRIQYIKTIAWADGDVPMLPDISKTEAHGAIPSAEQQVAVLKREGVSLLTASEESYNALQRHHLRAITASDAAERAHADDQLVPRDASPMPAPRGRGTPSGDLDVGDDDAAVKPDGGAAGDGDGDPERSTEAVASAARKSQFANGSGAASAGSKRGPTNPIKAPETKRARAH